MLEASQEVVETFDQREKVSYNLNSSCKERSERKDIRNCDRLSQIAQK